MLFIMSIFLVILLLDQLINRKLIKKFDIHQSEQGRQYVSDIHKYVENILHIGNLIIIVLAIMDFPELKPLIFLGAAAMFVFRSIMEKNYSETSRKYILSTVTGGLFLLGGAVYMIGISLM